MVQFDPSKHRSRLIVKRKDGSEETRPWQPAPRLECTCGDTFPTLEEWYSEVETGTCRDENEWETVSDAETQILASGSMGLGLVAGDDRDEQRTDGSLHSNRSLDRTSEKAGPIDSGACLSRLCQVAESTLFSEQLEAGVSDSLPFHVALLKIDAAPDVRGRLDNTHDRPPVVQEG